MSTERWILRLKAWFWRVGMAIGMFFHKIAPPRPKTHSFSINITTTISPAKGSIELVFYVPRGYRRPLSVPVSDAYRRAAYPIVVNFHGGGFTLGGPYDDARWASAVTENVDAVVVSVGYRLAPEYPFPTAVEDGVDAILWLCKHGKSMGLDPGNIALTGFSSGGNLCFTVALRLNAELKKLSDEALYPSPEMSVARLCALVSWYPSVDYTRTRAERRASNPGGIGKSLPFFLTNIFDSSYLHPRRAISMGDPYLSPAVAPDSTLITGLPEHIALYTCEWDQLFVEGEVFRTRLDSLGKMVTGRLVRGVHHGWDRAPNPFKADLEAEVVYREACADLKRAFKSEET
ncbi:hypothetical protein MMC07_008118 [Pseudocyphellaria aurata]|nr:hypothetical protein [Pseudocyphellaria aurata]